MAKSSRASRIKKNNQALKANVFGPVEAARNERLSAKLMELAQQPKPPKAEMETEQEDKDAGSEAKAEDVATMDIDQEAASRKAQTQGNGFRLERNEKQKRAKAARVEKSTRRKKPQNQILFAKTGKAKVGKSRKR